MDIKATSKLRLYSVGGFEFPSEARKYGRNWSYGVVTTSAHAAIEYIALMHPEMRIDSVNPSGVVDYIPEA